MARRLGADAAMADGLFDRLPNFQYATTAEILDIRDELAGSLSSFRQGVRELTKDIDLAPEDPQFGAEIEDAWNLRVAPALDEIEETIKENTSLRDIAKRAVKDTGALTAMGLTPAATLAVATGPVAEYLTAAGLVVGYGLTAARALIGEHEELRRAKRPSSTSSTARMLRSGGQTVRSSSSPAARLSSAASRCAAAASTLNLGPGWPCSLSGLRYSTVLQWRALST